MHTDRFSKNADYDFEIRTTLGQAPAGGSDVGEVLSAIGPVKSKDADGWFAAWDALAERTAAAASASSRSGHGVSAAGAYLRAANYYAVALNAAAALKESDQLERVFRSHRAAWEGFVVHSGWPVDSVAIPYEDSAMPGYLFKPEEHGSPRPTLVMNNGSDGAVSTMWGTGGLAALERGYNVLIFDGPGQQSMLFDHGVPFRPDWEAVLSPVLDFLEARGDVDDERIAVYGISQAGYWVPRALAHEHRFAAAIADPGVVDVFASWAANLPKSLLKLIDKGDGEKFDKDMRMGFRFQPSLERTWTFRARPYAADGYFATVEAVRQYKLAPTDAVRISTPLLITSPEDEQFWPGQSEQLAKLTPEVSTLIEFTAEEGANFHCQPMARSLTHERMFDWLDQQLAS